MFFSFLPLGTSYTTINPDEDNSVPVYTEDASSITGVYPTLSVHFIPICWITESLVDSMRVKFDVSYFSKPFKFP